MKKVCTIALSALLALSLLAGCGSSGSSASAPAASGSAAGSAAPAETVTLKVGASITPHAEILAQCKPILAEQGIDLEVVEYTDYVQPNTAVEEGDLDANYFQHVNYLNWFNGDYGTHLVSACTVHYEPFGIYAGKVSAIADLKDGDEIAVPNDGSNETRALLLLQQEGVITLNDGITAASNATIQDIASYNVKVNIREMEAAQLTLSLPDVAMAVINGNYALQGGLNAATDALAIEDSQGDAAQEYANILAVKEGRENDAAIQALVEALHSDTVKTYIENTYSGAVVPLF
ncbi:MetQ/NlpA family ABC transporter substrate-binding protein [Dysosmobacter sp. HCP28S3_G4]|uniref:MetQ/NlpA family ABC transporter substrate-binding protein n=1 Tax=Dysosmobacter sp. HCP28S3_G4 TaxID=3438938 RepID=UPI003EFDD980